MTKKTDTLLGVSEQSMAVNDVDIAVEEIERNGYTILDNVLSDAELIYLYDGVLERIYRIQCEEIGGEDVMLKIGEDGSVKHLFSYDDFFVQMLTKEPPFSIIKSFLGENISLYLQNAIMNFSGVENPASVWHRDLPYQHYVSDSPLALTSLYVVDEFNSDTGGPFVLSGSHKFGKFPSSQFVERHAQQICAPVGSVLLFDSMLYHQAGYNRSDKVRRAISQTFTVPIIRPQIDIPVLLDGKYSDDPILRKLFSYDYRSSESALAYRQRRIPAGSQRVVPGQGKRLTSIKD